MIGGGLHFTFGEDRNKETRCLVEAIMRQDTNLHVLTVSSGAGFVFTLSRPGGLANAAGELFLRNSEFTKDGETMRTVSKLSDGLVVTEIVIKFMIRDDNRTVLDMLGGPTGYRKQVVSLAEINAELTQHVTTYNAFNSGDSQIIPSLIGDAIELTHADILTVLTAVGLRPVTAKRNQTILVFEYFSDQIMKSPNRTVVGLFIEKVGHDDRKGDYSVVVHVNPAHPSRVEIIENAAIAACTTQIMIAGAANVRKILVDAHQGNWFIDCGRPTKFFAIDFGRLLDINRAMLWQCYRRYHAKYTNPLFPIQGSQRMPPNCVFFPLAEFDAQFDAMEVSLNELNTKTYTRSPASLTTRRAHVHRCLTMIAIFDNIYTDYVYGQNGTWNQPQMGWAYRIAWGYQDVRDVYNNTPIMLLPDLSTDYHALPPARVAHMNRIYDRICELRTTITSSTDTHKSKHRPIRPPAGALVPWSSIIPAAAGPAAGPAASLAVAPAAGPPIASKRRSSIMQRVLVGATAIGVAALAYVGHTYYNQGGNRTSKRKLSAAKNKNKNKNKNRIKTLKRN